MARSRLPTRSTTWSRPAMRIPTSAPEPLLVSIFPASGMCRLLLLAVGSLYREWAGAGTGIIEATLETAAAQLHAAHAGCATPGSRCDREHRCGQCPFDRTALPPALQPDPWRAG